MDDGVQTELSSGQLSMVTILIPIFMVFGAVVGYRFGAHFSTVWGFVGIVAGFILSVPMFGVTMLVFAGLLWVFERLFVRR